MLYFDSLVTDLANMASLAVGAVPATGLQDAVPDTTGTTWALFTQQGCYFLLKWIHFLAGITWIGVHRKPTQDGSRRRRKRIFAG